MRDAEAAWLGLAASHGTVGALAWIEVAKLREHRLGNLPGAIEAAAAALRLVERQAWLGRPLPRLEASLGTPPGAARRAGGTPPYLGEARDAEEARCLDRERCGGGGERRRVIDAIQQCRLEHRPEHGREEDVAGAGRVDGPIRRDRRVAPFERGLATVRLPDEGAAALAVGHRQRRARPEQPEQVGRFRFGGEVLPADADQRGGLEQPARRRRTPGDGSSRNEVAQQPLPADGRRSGPSSSAQASSTSSATGAIRRPSSPDVQCPGSEAGGIRSDAR